MQQQPLSDICDAQIRCFCSQTDALDLSVQEDKHTVLWQITTMMSRLDIVYLKKGTFLHAPSTLYARIFLYKNDTFFLLLHEMQQLCGHTFPGVSIYPYIENPQRMGSCICALLDSLRALLPHIRRYAGSEELYSAAKEAKLQEIYRIFSISSSDLPPRDSEQEAIFRARLFVLFEEQVILPRFTATESPFLQLAIGKRKRALKIYSKWESKGILSACEQQLLLQLRQNEEIPVLFPAQCNAVAAVLPYAMPQAEGKCAFLSILLCYLFFLPIFCGISALLYLCFSSGTLFYAGSPWYFGFITAGLAALFGGIALRRLWIPVIFHKAKEAALTADRMINGKALNIFAGSIFALALAVSFLFTALMSWGNVRFYEDHLVYPKSESFPITGTVTQEYTELSGLYKIEGRYNDYGEWIPRASYVLHFSDGTLLDLDGYLSLEDTQNHILPLITPFTGPPVDLPSDRELPQPE